MVCLHMIRESLSNVRVGMICFMFFVLSVLLWGFYYLVLSQVTWEKLFGQNCPMFIKRFDAKNRPIQGDVSNYTSNQCVNYAAKMYFHFGNLLCVPK